MFSALQSPPPLKEGEIVGVVSPSAGLAQLFPHRAERGMSMMREMGFDPEFSRHAMSRIEWTSASPEERAEDINELFARKDVRAIVCSIGGNHSNQIVKFLDFDLIKKNPKVFIGYSDITVLHYAFASQAHLRTFYGPCLISEFGEYPAILPYTRTAFLSAVTDSRPLGKILPSAEWTDEFLDWFTKKDLEKPRSLKKNTGYEWWRKGHASGPLWGGAIPSMNHLAGTPYWVDPTGTLFFIDLPEGAPGQMLSQSDVDAYLADLDNLGVFDRIAGLIIGRPYHYEAKNVDILKTMIMFYTKNHNYPILYGVDIGHTAPIMTVPLGASASLDAGNDRFEITESGVA